MLEMRWGVRAVAAAVVGAGGVAAWLALSPAPADVAITPVAPIEAVDAIQRQLAAAGARAPAARASEGSVMTAQAMSDQVRARPELVHQTRAGQRVALTGSLASMERGAGGVVLLSLAVEGRTQGLRLVVAPHAADYAATLPLGGKIQADCLSQGVLMGEWLLADCSIS